MDLNLSKINPYFIRKTPLMSVAFKHIDNTLKGITFEICFTFLCAKYNQMIQFSQQFITESNVLNESKTIENS